MEPNTKLLMEELIKQVHREIKEGFKEGFPVQTGIINKRFSALAVEDQKRDECVSTLESTTTSFDKAFSEWKLEVKDSISAVKLEMAKLNAYFDQSVKDPSAPKMGVIQHRSTLDITPSGFTADGPHGHRVDLHHRDCGYGSVYTHTHDPIKGYDQSPSSTVQLFYAN
jgi:hypothetical protein